MAPFATMPAAAQSQHPDLLHSAHPVVATHYKKGRIVLKGNILLEGAIKSGTTKPFRKQLTLFRKASDDPVSPNHRG